MMARTEIVALIANLKAPVPNERQLTLAALELKKRGHDEFAKAVFARSKPDPLHALAATLIVDLLERLATLEDQYG
jgi:hypothetical protein